MTFIPRSTSQTISSAHHLPEPDWHVLVLFADDSEKDVKGIWGPYTSPDVAASALEELRRWPLDGFWDMRRLNKFVARKSGNAPDQPLLWSWQ